MSDTPAMKLLDREDRYVNVRSRTGLKGSISCRVWDPDRSSMRADDHFTALLSNAIEASPALRDHLFGMAKSLDRVGPHSWLSLNERQVFGINKGPRFLRMRESRDLVSHERVAA